MCGIVGYFGSAPNSTTRLITGMSAIIYRAPDSTGIGTFGDISSSIVLRKTLGSVSRIMEVLAKKPLNRNPDKKLLNLWKEGTMTGVEMQKRLLEFEGLSLELFNKHVSDKLPYPLIEELLAHSSKNFVSISPGYPGEPGSVKIFKIRSRNDLRNIISIMIYEHDLSFVAIKSLFRDLLSQQIKKTGADSFVKADTSDIFNAFDHMFQHVLEKHRSYQYDRTNIKRVHLNPHAKKYLWQMISNSSVMIPDDFNNDGIACFFRLLDQALVSRIPHKPFLELDLQKILEKSLADSGIDQYCTWRTLYLTEKSVNIYGRAASAVLEWIQQNEILPTLTASISANAPESVTSLFGITGKRCLNYIKQPILAQGRWALQSAVTLKNSHPFIDKNGKRTIVLNGQFSSRVEDKLFDYLSTVARFSFRSNNSSEYFPLLWGHYFNIHENEKKRYQEVESQTEKGLEEYAAGSDSINYQMFKQIRNKSKRKLDEIAFIKTAKQFTKHGGQIAVAGLSIESPRTIYIAACNRPIFIVRRKSTDDYMVVSDINAALGLFSQSKIIEVTGEYDNLIKSKEKELAEIKKNRIVTKDSVKLLNNKYQTKIDKVLSKFRVDVYTLEGEEIFAKIFTCFENGILKRKIKISDFNNNILHDIEHSSINLTPSNVHKDMDKSFFESHLEEVPGLLEHIIPTIVNEDSTFNDLPINTKKLQSRFGKKLKGLKRIVLAGMGTSNHVTFFAAGLIRTILPDIQVVCIQPVDVCLPSSMFIPDADLVLLVSWSSTTAEMVKLAKTLNSMNVLFAGITEKTFGDMGIITQKNCGTIHVMSGEEITIPAIKSTFCSLLNIDLLILWLCSSIMEKQIDYTLLGNIRQLPEITKQIISNEKIKTTCENLSFSYEDTETFYIIDALNTTGTGYEAALKMEEMTWSVKTNAVDYKNVDINLFNSFKTKNFIIINATSQERIIEAIEIMEVFYKADIEFFAVTSEGSRIDRIETLSKGKMVILPRTSDCFQPFADLCFYYMLAFYSGNARGRKADDYPRNRAKSITTSRSMSPIKTNYQEEFFHIRNREKNIFNDIEAIDYTTLTKWESSHFKDWAKEYFHMMKMLAQAISCDNPFGTLFDYNEKSIEMLYSSIFDSRHDNDLFFLPLDLAAKTSVQNTIAKLNRFFPSRMICLTSTEPLSSIDSDSIVILVSSTGDPNDIPNDFGEIEKNKILWFGHNLLNNKTKFSMDKCVFKKDFKGIESSVLYAGLSLMLINAWKLYDSEKGNNLEKHFKRSCNVILSILNDQNLANDIIRVMHANQAYRSLYYLCPCDGTGNDFVKKFDMEGNRLAKWLSFGTGAHGSLVTVDNRVDTKYVRLEKRERMIQKYGEEKTIKWEKKYLNGENINLYLKTMPNDLTSRVETPFFAEGEWYLPILRPGYKACEDNLIVLDATSEINFDQATDDLAVFGCRHARMIIITQQAFLEMPKKNSIQKFPLSGMLALPAIKGFDQSIPLSELHLPFAINLMGAAMAGNIIQTDLS